MPSAAALPDLHADRLWADWSEPRPRDFSARFARKAQRGAQAPARMKRRWTLGACALAAIALPAFAAPGSWDRFQIANAVAEETGVQPMPFERAGASFPGSAFYYLQAEAPVQRIGEGIHSDAEDAPPAPATGSGPIARPMRIDNSGVDRTRAVKCMAAAIYYEAASESDAGQRAVAQVVLNRVAHPAYPDSVCGVVYQGSERASGCQFSFTCDGSLARRPVKLFWDRAERIAREALAGSVYAPVGLATHYHTVQVHPYWAASLQNVGTIGAHRFYRFKGVAGSPAEFRFAYMGGEPLAAPHPRSAASVPDPALDPVTVQRTFDALPQARAGDSAAMLPAAAAPAASYGALSPDRGDNEAHRANTLPEAHGIRPEYINSGRWIAQPGT